MSRQRILVTGCTGVVGRPLVSALCAAGNEVVALCRRPPKDTASRSPNCTYLSGDVSQPELGLDADTYLDLCTVDTIFHLAARTDFKGASVADYEAVNINGVKNIYALAAEAGAHLHHISTAFVCGDHAGVFHEQDFDCGQGFRNGYEESKFRGEQFLRAQMVHQRAAGDPAVTIYRPCIILERQPSQASLNTFGPFIFLDGVFRILLAASRKNLGEETVRVRGDVTGSLPFIFDDNVVEALLRISASPNTHGQTFHLLSAQPCPNRMMEDVFNAAFGREAARLADAHAFQQRPATAAEKIMARKTAMYDSYLDLDVRFDRTRLEALLGSAWRPAISEEELLTAFGIYLASKKEEDAARVLLPFAPRQVIEEYFDTFLPAFYGQQLIKGLASLSCQFWLEIASFASRTLHIDQGRLIDISPGHQGDFGYRVQPSTFLKVIQGSLSPQQGFFQGSINIEGNTMEALRTATALEEFFRTCPYSASQ